MICPRGEKNLFGLGIEGVNVNAILFPWNRGEVKRKVHVVVKNSGSGVGCLCVHGGERGCVGNSRIRVETA